MDTYDNLGRPSQIQFTEAGTTNYFVNWAFDATTGFVNSLTYPTSTASYRLKLQYDYQNGTLLRIKDFNAPATVFWQANATDARGLVLDENLGNGLRTVRDFDAVTGWLGSIQTGPGGGTTIQNLSYSFDKVGNLTQRKDIRQSNLTEAFVYDNLYRLDYSTLNGTMNLNVGYSALGNINGKSDLGAYTYDAVKIHAVNTVAGGAANTYDANGSLTAAPGLGTASWYSSGLTKKLDTGVGYASTFYYGPTGQRFKHVSDYPGGSEVTVYLEDLVEKVTDAGVTNWRHYIQGPTGPVVVYIRKSSGTPAAMAYYLTKDHLGSVDSITNSSGAVQVRLSYNAFGERRKEAGWADADLPAADWDAIYAITHRGFTFHESLDDLGIVHMNGRIYDPVSGRFASADPFIPDPLNTQSFNRYSYVLNNPLSFTDPSGFGKRGHAPKPATTEGGGSGGGGGSGSGTGGGGVMMEVLLTGTLLDPNSERAAYSVALNNSLRHMLQGMSQADLKGLAAEEALQEVVVTASKQGKKKETQGDSGKCTRSDNGGSVLDALPDLNFDLPSLPNGVVDFSAGLGDALLFGTGDSLRGFLGIDGGIDRGSGAYEAGGWTSFGFGAGRLGYAAVAKGYSVVASSGAAASAFRASMRMPGAPVRDLTKYTTDAALRAAAGRTNPAVNAAGAAVAAAGAYGGSGAGCN